MQISFVSAVLLMVSLATAPLHADDLKPADAGDLARISNALNDVQTLKADFIQIDPSGTVEQGQLFIQKPGKVRFQYQPPGAILVVSDGIDIAVFNTRLNTTDRYPLSATPLNILLSNHTNLKENKNVLGLEHRAGALILHARSNDRRMTGNISIVFSDPGLELRQWTVVDAQGLATTVSLRDVQTGLELSPNLFRTHG